MTESERGWRERWGEHWKIWRGVAIVPLVAFALSGCAHEQSPEAQPPLVRYEKVTVGEAAGTDSYPGSVRGRYESALSFQVSGKIIARNVNVGDRVSAGQVLMTLDSADVVQQRNQANASVAQAKAQLDLAAKNLARYKELFAEDATPKAALDQQQANYDAALATWQRAVAAEREGQNAVSYTNLRAPSDGVISSVAGEVGQVVAAGQQVLGFVENGSYEASVSVPESEIDTIAVGDAMDVVFWALGENPVPGVVREIAPIADPVTRTYNVRVTIPTPPSGMALGMTATAKRRVGKDGVAHLPIPALWEKDGQSTVWRITADNKVEEKKVTLVGYEGDEALVQGLENGDLVVTAGTQKLLDGEQVRLGDDAS